MSRNMFLVILVKNVGYADQIIPYKENVESIQW